MSRTTVSVRTSDIGIPHAKCTSAGYRTFKRQVEPLLCLIGYQDVEASKVSVMGHEVIVYKRLDQAVWSSDRKSVVEYAAKRG